MNTKQDKTKAERLAPLSFIVAFWLAVIIGIAMAVYALWQFRSNPDLSLGELFQRHLLHVLLLGGLIHVALWICLDRLLIQPIKAIYLRLYDLGGGIVEPIEIETSVREVHTIVDGFNTMVWRLRKWTDVDALESAREKTAEIGLIAKELEHENKEVSGAILKRLEILESSLLSMEEASSRPENSSDSPTGD